MLVRLRRDTPGVGAAGATCTVDDALGCRLQALCAAEIVDRSDPSPTTSARGRKAAERKKEPLTDGTDS